jgi:hypothetical protein
MTKTTTLVASLVIVLLAALSTAAGTASAAGPTITVGTGCAAQCITKAVVTTTTTTAKVDLATTVLAHLTVYVTKQGSSGTTGGLTANQVRAVSISAFSTSKTARFKGLESDTTYAITVKATDLKGQKAYAKGTFSTRAVKTSGLGGATGLDSGLGCSAQCITRALFTQQAPSASIAHLDVATATDARIQVVVSRDKPSNSTSGPAQHDVVSSQSSPGFTRSWKTQVGGLGYGTKYYAVVRATDSQGRTSVRQGSFRTVGATAVVTIHKIKVVNDGDKGRNKGELYFRLWVGDDDFASWGTDMVKLGSGAVYTVGPSTHGYSFDVPANSGGSFSMEMLAEECDAALKKNCIREAGGGNKLGDWALAGGTFDVSGLLSQGALPPWYGTGVAPPSGHDGYFTFGTTARYVKFHVLATIDLVVDWP